MRTKDKKVKRALCIALFCAFTLCLVLYELIFKHKLFTHLGEWEKEMTDMLITRALGGAIFLVFTIYLGYRVLDPIVKPRGKNLLYILPALVIAINNMPIIPLILGQSRVTAEYGKIILLLFECMAVGFFEEMAFRSVVMLGIMENRRSTKKDIFVSVLLSSAVFGLVHIINLFQSPSVMVALQILYSALIGAMCAVVLLLTRNIWACVVIHGLFNFFGAIVSECGEGKGFFSDIPTQILTAVVAIAVIAIYILWFLRLDARKTDEFYPVKSSNE